MTLERAIQYLRDDEMVEVTPKSIRLRKTTLLEQDRRYNRRERP
jgi:GTP-binding protein